MKVRFLAAIGCLGAIGPLLSLALLSSESIAQQASSKPAARKAPIAKPPGSKFYIVVSKPEPSPTRYYPVGSSLFGVRADTPDEALSIVHANTGAVYGSPPQLTLLDTQKCQSGLFAIGFNQFSVEDKRAGIAAIFLHCNYESENEVIQKGVLDSGRSFWKWGYGEITGSKGMIQLIGSCHYYKLSGPYYEATGNSRASWENSSAVFPGSAGTKPEFCDRLNAEVPMLVDREPQETIMIMP